MLKIKKEKVGLNVYRFLFDDKCIIITKEYANSYLITSSISNFIKRTLVVLSKKS